MGTHNLGTHHLGRHTKTRRYWLGSVLAALLTVGATAAVVVVLTSQHTSAQQLRQQGADNALLQVATQPLQLATEMRREVKLTGRVVARQSVSLAFEPAGRVIDIRVDRGDRVEQGEVLARLDTRRLESRLAEVAARSEEARAALALAQRQEERESQLNQSNFASRTALDQARTERLSQQARLAALAAEQESLSADLADSTLTAPFAGQIVARQVDVGSLVSSGTAAFDLVDTRQLEAHIGLPARLAGTLAAGDTVTITVHGQAFEGDVRARLAQVDNDSRTQTLVVALANPENVVPGDLATLTYTLAEPAEGYWVPLSALRASDRGLWNVLIAEPLEDERYRVATASVELLHTEGDRAFVRGTLLPGMQLITQGAHRIVPGQQVTLARGIAHAAS